MGVLDGGTLEVLNGPPWERIRLDGIGCPEKWINSTISQFPRLAVSSVPSYNTPPCEASMPFLIFPSHRFPMALVVIYNSGPLLNLPLAINPLLA